MSVLFREPDQVRALRVAEELLFVTGLSRNLHPDGRLSESGKTRARTALRHFAGRLEILGVEPRNVRAVATAGIRRSTDGLAFLRTIREELGLELEVVTGQQEAELSALAQERSFPRRCPLLVADIGGRSTEIALRFPGKTAWKTSLDIGSVVLGEKHGSEPSALAEAVSEALEAWTADLALQSPAPPQSAPLVGVAGTVTTASQLLMGTTEWDPSKLHGSELERASLLELIQHLGGMTSEQRRSLPGLHPRRAELIVAGLSLLVGLMDALQRDRCLVSDRGVRYGLLWRSWPMARIRD